MRNPSLIIPPLKKNYCYKKVKAYEYPNLQCYLLQKVMQIIKLYDLTFCDYNIRPVLF